MNLAFLLAPLALIFAGLAAWTASFGPYSVATMSLLSTFVAIALGSLAVILSPPKEPQT